MNVKMPLNEKLILDLLSIEFLGNTIQNILFAIALFLTLKFSFKYLSRKLVQKLSLIAKKTETKFDDYIADVLSNIPASFYDLLSLYFAFKTLFLNPLVIKILDILLISIVIFQIINSCNTFSIYVLKKIFHTETINEEDKTVFDGLTLLIKILLWITGILFLLANLGVNISSLATSLGIGGIAIALAVQNILGDLFSSFSIYFDKPFSVGDTIIVDKYTGTVKRIGLKSTRIQTLQGEELVIGNKELISSKIQNLKKMERRRVNFFISLSHDCTATQIKKAKEIIIQAVREAHNVELERVNFFEFTNTSLNIEVVYFHNNPNGVEYMNEREAMHLKIKEGFEKEGIHLAHNKGAA